MGQGDGVYPHLAHFAHIFVKIPTGGGGALGKSLQRVPLVVKKTNFIIIFYSNFFKKANIS